MDPVVFIEKVRRPDPRGLVRRRLEDRLLAPEAPPLGLVLGPPGSGKTTLLTRVAAAAPVPAAWYRADSDDLDEAALARHLARAIEEVRPGGGLAPGRSAPATVTELVGRLQSAPEPIVVVVDDLHEIAGTPAERALARFLDLRPRSVRVLLGSRRPPAVNTTRLLVSGDLGQLDGDDLRFRSWEVEELFRTVYRQPLSPETAAALTRRTGGWAAGLQLFHLGSAGMTRGEREEAVAELSGRSRLIRSYLARNVLDGLDAERRSFLLRTCTLGVLTGETCDALLGTTGSATVLDDLEQQHFFTTSTDDGRTFRYHQVLQTHLEVVLVDELGAAAARALYARSAALLEQSGRVAAAVRAHARADDWTALARLLPHLSPAQPADDEALWSALGLPGSPVDDPGLVVAYARRLLRHGLVPEAVAAFGQAEALMDDLDFRARCATERRAAALWLAQPGPLVALRPPGDRTEAVARDLRRATQQVAPEQAGTALGRAVAQLLAGHLDSAAEAGAVAATQADGVGERLVVDLVQVLVETLSNGRPPAVGRLEDVVSGADQHGLPWVSRLARGWQGAALLLGSPSADRAEACAELLEDGERTGDPWSQLLIAVAVGAASALVGQEAEAASALRRAESVAADLHAPALQCWAAVLRVASALRAGDTDARAEADEVGVWAARLGVDAAAALLHPGGLDGWAAPPAPTSVTSVPRPVAAPVPVPSGPVRLQCLGGFSLTLGGREVGWATLRPRARELLMMLAASHQQLVHRERLVDALWPEATLPAGIRSLQVAVSSVRQCLLAAGLGEDALGRTGPAYVLSLPDAVDERAELEALVAEAERRLAAGDRVQALRARLAATARYAGDLLPEAGPAEWVVEDRARLRALAARVAAGAAALALDLGQTGAGLGAARRSVELDPYQDGAWTVLALLHEHDGDLTAAAVARREHRRVCTELGLPPPVAPLPAPRLIREPARASRGVRAPA